MVTREWHSFREITPANSILKTPIKNGRGYIYNMVLQAHLSNAFELFHRHVLMDSTDNAC